MGVGLIGPEEFVGVFGGLPTPRVLFQGRFSGQLVEDVRRGVYSVEEGSVIKGGSDSTLWMAKVKTDAYLARLKAAFGPKWEAHWE